MVSDTQLFNQITDLIKKLPPHYRLRLIEFITETLKPNLQTMPELESNETAKSHHPNFGSAKHLNITMSDDFDEPLEDFAEYMP